MNTNYDNQRTTELLLRVLEQLESGSKALETTCVDLAKKFEAHRIQAQEEHAIRENYWNMELQRRDKKISELEARVTEMEAKWITPESINELLTSLESSQHLSVVALRRLSPRSNN